MIELTNLTKRFGSTCAVNDLTLNVPEGEFFCFLGPNGAGKTTTIKMIAGLLIPTSGGATIGGYDIQKNPVEAKRLMGYIPDQPFLYEKLTGREFMQFVGGLYEIDDAVTASVGRELMEAFGVGDVADQLIENYSHGMRQKLIFAATFLHEPRLVVVDEPWVGLDPRSIRFVKDYLRQKSRNGVTVFMSTHTLSIAEEVADRIGIINNGKLIALGSVDEIRGSEVSAGFEDVFLRLTEEEEPQA